MNTKTLSSVLTALALTTNAFAASPAAPAKPAVVPAAPAAAVPFVRISAIDGVVNPNHKASIKRRAKQKVKFAVDLFTKENGKLVPQHIDPSEFTWRISTYLRDCDPTRVATCKNTNIEPTAEGVTLTLTQDMFDMMVSLQNGVASSEGDGNLHLKVTYAKNRKLTDTIAILDIKKLQEDAENERNNAEIEKATRELEESQHTGLTGFFNALLGVGSSSSSSSDDSYSSAQEDEYARHRQQMDNIRALETSNPSLAHDLREIEMNNFRASHPRGDDGGRDWHRGGDDNRFGHGEEHRFDRHEEEARPVPPAPIPSAPQPSPGFGGRDHRDGGFRPNAPAPQPAPPAADPAAAAQQAAAQAAMLERIKAIQAQQGGNVKSLPMPGPGAAMGGKAFGR